jgi:hypothetical protein
LDDVDAPLWWADVQGLAAMKNWRDLKGAARYAHVGLAR